MLYVCSILFTPKWVIAEADKLMFKFLWSNKKPYVKRTTIVANINEGGLKMVHFESMVKAIKLNWIKRFDKSKSNYYNLVDCLIGMKVTISNLVKCHIKKKDLEGIQNSFYKQIMMYWSSIYTAQTMTPTEIYNQVIWVNSSVSVDSKPILYKHWWKHGIIYIYHIMNDDGRFKTKKDIELLFDTKVNQMDYNSLISAFPKKWQTIIQENDVSRQIKEDFRLRLDIKSTLIAEIKCADYYKYFLSKIIEAPTAIKKWNETFNMNAETWQTFFTLPYETCVETNLQSFQYKILNRFFPCNYNLSLWFKEVSNVCEYCQTVTDTTVHYFFSCEKVCDFWYSFSRWWKNVHEFRFVLTERDIIFGIQNPNNDLCIDNLNYCILIGKYYIYTVKKCGKVLFLFDFLQYIKNKIEIIYTMHCLQDKLDIFEKKWSTLYNSL